MLFFRVVSLSFQIHVRLFSCVGSILCDTGENQHVIVRSVNLSSFACLAFSSITILCRLKPAPVRKLLMETEWNRTIKSAGFISLSHKVDERLEVDARCYRVVRSVKSMSIINER